MILIDGYLDITIYIHTYIYICMSTNNPNNKLQSHWILPANITAILECIYQIYSTAKG